MAKKRYQVTTACPQCGCSFATHLTDEELKERYGDVPNVEMDCGECMLHYTTAMEEACPEWDKECKLTPSLQKSEGSRAKASRAKP